MRIIFIYFLLFCCNIIGKNNINLLLSKKIMKLQEDQQNLKFNMIKNQGNLNPSTSKQPTKLNNNNSSLLIPFDQSSGPNKIHINNFNDLSKNHQTNTTSFYNSPSKEIYYSNKNSNNAELSDNDDSDYIHVTFDLTENAANLLQKVTQENFQRLEEIGILSIKLNDEKPIKINSFDEKKNTKQNLTVSNNSNNFTVNEIKQEKPAISSNKSNESLKNLQPTGYFQQTQPSLQTNNNSFSSTNINLTSTPPARKRNRKTINELTNHLSTGNSYSNYTNEIPNDDTRNNKLNENLCKNIVENSSTTQNTKRKRTNKSSNDNSLDLNGSFNKTNEFVKEQTEPLNNSQEQNEAQFGNNNNNNNIIGSDIKQVYIIDKNIPPKVESQNSFQNSTSNSYLATTFSRLNNTESLVIQNQNVPINFSDNNFNEISRQKDVNQQIQMMHQQQNHQYHHQQQPIQQQVQYQSILNNQKLNQNSQQYKMPSPMLANILSNNEIINSNSYTQLNTNQAKINSNEVYLINNNNLNKSENMNQIIDTMNPNEINKNNDSNYIINNNQTSLNKQYHSINELQLLKSEDYKQIYQIRQNLIANQSIQYNQINTSHIQNSNEQIHQPVQPQNNIINIYQQQVNPKRRRLPADPSKTRAKRAKTNISTDQTISNNLLPSDISNLKESSLENNMNKTSVNLSTNKNIENNNISSMITLAHYPTSNYNDEKNINNISDYTKQNNDSIKLTNNYESPATYNNLTETARFENPNFINPIIQNNSMDKYIDFNITNSNRDLINKEQNTITKYECNSIGSSNNSNCGSNASIDSSPILKDKPKNNNENVEENTSKINIQLVGSSVNYSNQIQSLDNLNNGQQPPSNLIYLNSASIDKSKSLNFVSFKLSNNNNNMGPVSSSFSSSSTSSSSYTLEPNQNFKNNNLNNSNLIFTNTNPNNNNFNTNSFTSLSTSSTASSSFQNLNNYDLNKSNSPIYNKDSVSECISNGLQQQQQQQILNGNTLQFISTDDGSK